MIANCMIIGDSIAVGTSQYRKDCISYAQTGISTHGWLKKYRDKQLFAKTVVISLGSNDIENMRHEREDLEYLRNSIDSDRVLWILPSIKPQIRDIIYLIAENWGDDLIEVNSLEKDGVHPTTNAYKAIAKTF